MSENVEEPLTPTHNVQSQIQQYGDYSTSRAFPSNGVSQFEVPFTPRPVARSGEQIEQYSIPGVPPSNRVSQFKVPATPYMDVPTTPLPVVPATPSVGVPAIPGIPPAIVNPRRRERVERYEQWLLVNNNLPASPQKIQVYQDAAMEIKQVGRREVRTFAPFQEHTSALTVITSDQLTILGILGLYWIVGLLVLHLAMITITVGIVTLLYMSGFVISSILATNSFSSSSGEKIDEKIIHALDQQGIEWPSYTILCPLYKEAAIVPQFVEAMKALDYPMEKLQVLFLTEENDNETRVALYRMQLPACFTILTVPKGTPQTKPRACNFGLLQAKGQFVVIFDAEDKPEPSQLKKAILTFANHGPEVACVQAKLNYYNAGQNLLTRWFTAEYSTWFDIMLPGLQRSGFSLPLGGTSNHFRTEVLRALGGWDAFNVTEDCDLGLRISQYNLKTAVLDSTTYEEATSRFKTWLFQRSRWIKGYLQTYLVHMRHPVQMLRQGRLRKFFSLQLIVGAWTIVLLINPFMWALTVLYMLFRPVQLYSILFPGPILYMGAFCLIFGNFFYVYIHIIGCLRRKEYALMKWVLLIPLYWVMMSASAYIAFYQLIVKPHYWEKTQHGAHLAPTVRAQVHSFLPNVEPEGQAVVASMPTMHMFAVTAGKVFKRTATPNTLERTTQRVTALRSTLSTQLGQGKARRQIHLPRIRDRWLIATILIASIASIASTWYVFQHNDILIYGDAIAHLELSRHVIDSITPGLAQIGGVWLPLPHLLMLPFIWNDYLWMTGLAGSAVGMGCYMVTAIYIFLTVKRLTKSSCASFIGSIVFILNPNILYLQSTPLTEPVCWATYTMASYYLLAWAQEDETKYLFLAAGTTFLATLARYDGWILFVLFPIVIIITELLRHHPLRKIEGNVGSFLVLSSLGIILWLIWGKIIFGDPLYFQHGPYSSQAATISAAQASFSYQLQSQPLLDVKIIGIGTVETMGIAITLLALVGTLLFTFRRWRLVDTLASLAHWAPLVFYIAALNRGQVNMFNIHIGFYPLGIIPMSESANLYNSRFGSEMVAPAAVFIATLVPVRIPPKIPTFLGQLAIFLRRGLLILVIILQSAWVAYGGVISIISDINPPFCVNNYNAIVYLEQHYNGGFILQTEAPFHLSESAAGIHFSNVVYEGTSTLWTRALNEPPSVVDWVILQEGDIVAKSMAKDGLSFSQNFTLVATDPYSGLRLYHKNGLPPLPTRPISLYLLNEKQFCSPGTYQHQGNRSRTPRLKGRGLVNGVTSARRSQARLD